MRAHGAIMMLIITAYADIVEHREMEDGLIELEKDASSYTQMVDKKVYLKSLPKMKEQENSQAGLTHLQYAPRRCGNHQHQPSSRKIEYYSTSTSSESDEGKSPNHRDNETKRHSLICYADIRRSSSINSQVLANLEYVLILKYSNV